MSRTSVQKLKLKIKSFDLYKNNFSTYIIKELYIIFTFLNLSYKS